MVGGRVVGDGRGVEQDRAVEAAAQGASQVADASLLEAIESVLERYGVTKYQGDGDGIDRSRQKVIDVELTDEAGLDRRLARRLRPGFEIDGKVLRPEWVVAYRLMASSRSEG